MPSAASSEDKGTEGAGSANQLPERGKKKIKSLPSWLHCVRGRGGEQGDTISHCTGKGSEGSHGSTQHSPICPRVVLLVTQVQGHTLHPYASAGPKAQMGCAENCKHMSYGGSPRSAASPPVGWQGSQVSLTQMSQPPALASWPESTSRHFMLKTIHSLLLGHNTPLVKTLGSVPGSSPCTTAVRLFGAQPPGEPCCSAPLSYRSAPNRSRKAACCNLGACFTFLFLFAELGSNSPVHQLHQCHHSLCKHC